MKHTRILALIALLGVAALGLPSLRAATITVTTINDNGAGSLRQALADAVAGDTINFDSSLDGQTIFLTGGQLVVNKSVAINGPDPDTLAVDASQTSRVFRISSGKTVTISGLSIVNGYSEEGGGAIYNDHSTLAVSNCTIAGNFGGIGGAVWNDGGSLVGSATLTVNNSNFIGNSTWFLGGAIFNGGQDGGSATLIVNNSNFSDNSSTLEGASGGGIVNFAEFGGSAPLTLNNSTFSGNSAWTGGGLFNSGFSGSAPLTLANCTFSGNWAVISGGGIFNYGLSGSAPMMVNNSTFSSNSARYYGGRGGAIINVAASLTLNNCTVSGNSATDFGGGIDNDALGTSAALTLNNSTFSGNSASSAGAISNFDDGGSATVDLTDTILNAGISGINIYSDGTVTSHGYNLSNDNGGGFLTATGDQISTDPSLGPLQDNGGPTFTHALLPGSPAIDAGDPNFTLPPDYDQRGTGFPRVFNSRVDIGAFEVQSVAPSYAGRVQPPINPDGTSVFSSKRGVVPVKFTLTRGGVATCDLPPATIAVTRTAGGVTGQVNESVYSDNADTGSNFRIDSCQYIYNLNSRALGVGVYRVDILINGQVVGNAVFTLN